MGLEFTSIFDQKDRTRCENKHIAAGGAISTTSTAWLKTVLYAERQYQLLKTELAHASHPFGSGLPGEYGAAFVSRELTVTTKSSSVHDRMVNRI